MFSFCTEKIKITLVREIKANTPIAFPLCGYCVCIPVLNRTFNSYIKILQSVLLLNRHQLFVLFFKNNALSFYVHYIFVLLGCSMHLCSLIKQIPNKTVKYTMISDFLPLSRPILSRHIHQQNVELVTTVEQLHCCNNMGRKVGREWEVGKGETLCLQNDIMKTHNICNKNKECSLSVLR